MRNNDDGSIVVVVAIIIPLLLLFMVSVIDFGLIHYYRSSLQAVADAATLAGVMYSDEEAETDYDTVTSGGVPLEEFKSIKIKVNLNKDDLAEGRARETFEKNKEKFEGTGVEIHEEKFKEGDFGTVTYTAEVIKKETTSDGIYYTIGKMGGAEKDTDSANAYTLSFKADLPTILIGSFYNRISRMFSGGETSHEDINKLTWEIYSESKFNLDTIIREDE